MVTYTQQADCRSRLILAARKLFAEQGLQGATTREIARKAGVNELTLFRHFRSKGNLLSTVLHDAAEEQSHVGVSLGAGDKDMAAELLSFARAFNEMLETHEGLIRALIGEAHRDPDASEQVTDGAFAPWRLLLKNYLSAQQESGAVLSGIELSPVVDHFLGMLMGGMLRRTCPWAPKSYTADDYLRSSVDVFVRGISASPDQKPPARRIKPVAH